MANILSSQGYAFSLGEGAVSELGPSQMYVLAVTQIPADFTNISESFVYTIGGGPAGTISIPQISTLGVLKGKVDNPKLRSWSFFLDNHEFWVIRLGDNKTLLYDLTTEQWTWWSTANRPTWRANIGLNWYTPGSQANMLGSNVFVGDDSTGIIWALDPKQGFDQHGLVPEEPVYFKRIAQAQIISRTRIYIPVYSVYLTCSPASPAYLGATVTLEYSDDGGSTYVTAGDVEVNVDDYNQDFSWFSLGRIQTPGRLFRITDNGGLARIDNMNINLGDKK